MKQKDNSIKFISGIRYIVIFHNHILKHNRILQKVNNDYYNDNEQNHLQEAILIKQMTAWEEFLFSIIPYCISLDTSNLANYIGVELPKNISFDNALAIINGINFTNISNTSELKNLSERIITDDNNPFQQFLPPMLRYIDEIYFLRNYVAHQSYISKSKVESFYKESYGIKKFIVPGEFLRTRRTYEIGKVFPFEQYYFVLMQIAVFSWRFLDKDSYDKIYAKNNPKEIVGLGNFNMSIAFEKLSESLNL